MIDRLFIDGSRDRFRSIAVLVLLSVFALAGCEETAQESVDELLERAVTYHEAGDLRAASIDLKSLLRQDPNHVEARLMLGKIYLGIGDANSAEKEFSVALELGARESEIRFLVGKALLLKGAYEKLLEDYQVTEDLKAGTRSQISYLRGEAYLARRQLDLAQKAFQDAIDDYRKDINEERPHLKLTELPEFVDAIIALSKVRIEEKNWNEAQALIDTGLKLAPKHPKAFSAQGDLAFDRQEYEFSEKSFEEAFKLQPNNLEFQVGIARAQLMQEKFESAVENLDQVLKQFPDHVVTNYFRGLASMQLKQYLPAMERANKILQKHPNYTPALLVAGVSSFGLGNIEQANLFLRRYLEAAPENEEVRKLLGITQMNLSQPDKALGTLQSVLEKSPENTELLSLVATAAAQSGDLMMASDYLRKSLELVPDESETRLKLASVSAASGKQDDALRELEETIQKSPEFLRGKYALLGLYLKSESFEKAVGIAREIQEVNPSDPTPFIGEGLAQIGLEKWEEAKAAFNRALEIKPDHVGAKYGLADIHLRKNELDEVRKIYENILASKNEHFRTLLRLISLSQRQGRLDEIPDLINRAAAADPTSLVPPVLLAQIQLDRKQPLRAIATLNNVAEKHKGDPRYLMALGRAQLAAKKPGQAIRTLESLVKKTPDAPGARYVLAQAYTYVSSFKNAAKQLVKSLESDPDFIPASIALVRVLYLDGETAAAKEILKGLVEKHPDALAVDDLQAWVAIEDKRHADAIPILARMYEKKKSRKTAVLLASSYWQTKDRKSALEVLGGFVEKNPKDTVALIELANLHTLAGNAESARKAWTAVVDLAPDNWVALNNLADLSRDHDIQAALRYAEKAHALAPGAPPVALTLVEILLQNPKEDPKRVLKLAQSVSKRFPENVKISLAVAQALILNGRTDEAVGKLEQIVASASDKDSVAAAKKLLNAANKQ